MSDDKVVQKSVGWSFFAEIAAKFVTPVTNMILARLLVPEDFGVLAICNMLVSFADIITDAGFAKFLIQRDFQDDFIKSKYACVAFWTNFILSVVVVFLIFCFRIDIAELLGNADYAFVICIASTQLVITSISSIQMGLFRRAFNYKQLFVIRMTVVFVPLLITIPLAYYTRSYWSLVIGSLAGALANSVMLTSMSSWRPHFYYSFTLLKDMFSYSFWSLCEGLGNWFIFWIDTFILASNYTDYYLGIYKNSSNIVMSIMGMVSAAISPVLLSVLSRLKGRKEDFYSVFLDIFKIMSYVTIPMGAVLFFFRDVVTYVFLGSQWGEAANVVGAWGLMLTCSIIFYTFTAELYKSTGIPKILFLFQFTYLIFLIPVCIYAVRIGFWEFVYIRCLCVLEQVAMSLIFLKIFYNISAKGLLGSLVNPVIASLTIAVMGYVNYQFYEGSIGINFLLLIGSICAYAAFVVLVFRNDLMMAKNRIQKIKI